MNKKNTKKFSYNYFLHLANKYNLYVSKKNPIVIFLDGKNVTSSNFFNLIDESANSFNDYFEKAVRCFCKKYKCIAIYGIDEVSFIFENADSLICDNDFKNLKSQNIVSVFSQKFFEYMIKTSNKKYKIYWHCKLSNIPKGKIMSYIKYRSITIHELFITYFLKKMNVKNAGKIKLSEKIKMANSYKEFSSINQFAKGHLCINGDLIDLESYINNNNIVKLPEIERENNFFNLLERVTKWSSILALYYISFDLFISIIDSNL